MRLECTSGGHFKFWEIEVSVANQIQPTALVRWGKIGTSGQSQVKRFPTAEAAAQFGEDMINSKLRKGYRII